MSDSSIASAYVRVASLVLTAEQPESFTVLPVWNPVLWIDSPWERPLNEQLAAVLRGWLRGKAFSRRNRREYAKLNPSVRTAEAALEPLSRR